MPELMPWEFDVRYSQCGQSFFSLSDVKSHEDICGYCRRQNERNAK